MVEKLTRPGKESRLKDIRRAARKLFSEQGYDAVTTKMIAETAEISRGLIYRYHGTKEEILSDVLIEFLEEEALYMSDWVSSSSTDFPREKGETEIIAEYFREIFEYDTKADVIGFRKMAARQSWSWDNQTELRVYEKAGTLLWPLNELLERQGFKHLEEAVRNAIWAIYNETLRKAMARADEGNISRGHWQMLFEQSLRVLRL